MDSAAPPPAGSMFQRYCPLLLVWWWAWITAGTCSMMVCLLVESARWSSEARWLGPLPILILLIVLCQVAATTMYRELRLRLGGSLSNLEKMIFGLCDKSGITKCFSISN